MVVQPKALSMAEDGGPPPKKARLSREEFEALSKEELVEKCCEQEVFIKNLETKVSSGDENEEKLKQQQEEATRRESILVLRLTTKEQEVQKALAQINEMKQAENSSAAQLRSMLLDPAINLMFQRMKKEMETAKERQEQAENDMAAWKFTPDSHTGKRLMNKCRMLLQENEEIGKVIASGRTAKLEGEIALEKKFIEEMKKSQAETDDFLVEMDEDVEGMQSTIYLLQQQLKDARDQLSATQAENLSLRQRCVTQDSSSSDPSDSTLPQPSAELTVSPHNSTGHEPTSLREQQVRTPSLPTKEVGTPDRQAWPQQPAELAEPEQSGGHSRCESPAPSTCHDTVSTTNGCSSMDTSGPVAPGDQVSAADVQRTTKCPPLSQPSPSPPPPPPQDSSMDSDVWSSPTSMDVDDKVYRTPETTTGLQNGLVTSATDP